MIRVRCVLAFAPPGGSGARHLLLYMQNIGVGVSLMTRYLGDVIQGSVCGLLLVVYGVLIGRPRVGLLLFILGLLLVWGGG